jgi:putative tryptophan/tyrosine transport system substrate-binding protein
MTRFCTALVFLIGLPGLPAAHAQQAGKVYRVGVVSVLVAKPEPPQVRALRQELRTLGYVEGKNVILDIRYAEGRPERLPDLFADLIKQKVDVLVTGSVMAGLAAKKTTTTVPIVVAGTQDLVSPGIVSSLARPGGNITGATFAAGGAEIASKWVELLKEAVPSGSHFAVVYNSADPQTASMLAGAHAAARSLKIKLDQFDAGTHATLEKAFRDIAAGKPHGMIVLPTSFYGGNRLPFVRFAAEKRLPTIYFFNLFTDDGGLMSYGGSVADSYRRAAHYVDKILRGAKPADLPVDQPTKFELVINLKAAREIGLTIPHPVLFRADRVIE